MSLGVLQSLDNGNERVNKIIIAPHADDEVIGCSQLLGSSCHVIFTTLMSKARRKEAQDLAEEVGFEVEFKDPSFVLHDCFVGLNLKNTIIIAPDPILETHPAHRLAGFSAWQEALRYKVRFATYTTNMMAPYTRELDEEDQVDKKSLLGFYPSQKSLWKNDHKYFLFEGLCEWNPKLG